MYMKRGGHEEELGKVEGTDVLVARYRHGTAYLNLKVCDNFLFSLNISSRRLLMFLYWLLS